MVERLNKTDILVERMISVGKTKAYLRIPVFIAIVFVLFFAGIAEKAKALCDILFPTGKAVTRCLAFMTAVIIALPLMQPVGVFAQEVTESISEQSVVEDAGDNSEGDSGGEPEENSPTSEASSGDSGDNSDSPESSEENTGVPSGDSTEATDATSSPEAGTGDISDTTTVPSDTSAESSESSDASESAESTASFNLMLGALPAANDSTEAVDLYDAIINNEDITLLSDVDMTGKYIPFDTEYTGTITFGDFTVSNLTLSIDSKEDLKTFLNSPNRTLGGINCNIILEADIDFGNTDYTPKEFSNRVFDGNGHVISNISDNTDGSDLGMFKVLTDSTVKNLGIKNFNFSTNRSSKAVGSIAGSATGSSAVINCFAANGKCISENGFAAVFVGGNKSNFATENCCYRSVTLTSANNSLYAYVNNASNSANAATMNEDTIDGIVWYDDTNPIRNNYGCPSFSKTYKVNFLENDGDDDLPELEFTVTPQTGDPITAGKNNYYITEGQGLAELTTPHDEIKPRAEFVGWATRSGVDYVEGGENPYIIDNSWEFTPQTGQVELNLYAVWIEKNVYKLEYHTYDAGTDTYSKHSESVEVNVDTLASDPLIDATALKGYEYSGWYMESSIGDAGLGGIKFGNEWVFGSSTISDDEFDDYTEAEPGLVIIKLYQKYDLESYKLNLNTNGGTVSISVPSTYTIVSNDIVLPVAGEISRAGFNFGGWAVSPAVGGHNAGDIITVVDTDWCTDNITVTAQWTPITYKVHYDGNDAVSGEMTDSDHTYTIAKNLSANQYSKGQHYTFGGWQFGDKKFTDGQSVSNLTTIDNSTVTLYAIWDPVQYTINYIDDTGVGNMQNSTQNPATYDVTKGIITLSAPKKSGYVFKGWYEDAARTIPITEIDCVARADSGALTVYAKWEPITYTVVFDTNGGNFTSGSAPNVNYNIESSITALPDQNVISRDYYTFSGWKVADSNSNIARNEVISEIPSGTFGTLRLQAQWTPIEYNIHFDPNGGDPLTNPISKYTYESTDDLPIPTKTGYDFVGWKITASSDAGIVHSVIAALRNNYGDLELEAVWEVKKYTITFNSNGGSEVMSITQDFGSALTKPTDPTMTGYDFRGWYDTEDLSGSEYIFTDKTMPASDFTLYAKWEIRHIPVTFYIDDGQTVSTVQTVDYGNTPERYVPSRGDSDGFSYYFLGWYADAGLSEIYDFSEPILDDTSVYAKWLRYAAGYTPATYSVSVKTSENADPYLTKDCASGEHLVLPEFPADDIANQKSVVGWKIFKESGEAVSDELFDEKSIYIIEDFSIVIIAQWDTQRYDVEFYSEGNLIDTQRIEYNKPISQFTPTRSGFIFKGWVYTADMTTSFDVSTPITEATSLTAVWEEIVIPGPGGGGSSGGGGSTKIIRIAENTSGIPYSNQISVSANMAKFTSSVDVRLSNATEVAESEFSSLISRVSEISNDKYYVFDISLYERGTTRKIESLKAGTVITFKMPIPAMFGSDTDRIKVLSVNNGKLELHDSEVYLNKNNYPMIKFTTTHCSTYAFVLDAEDKITIDELSAAAGFATTNVLLVTDARVLVNDSPVFSNKRGSIFSRKKKKYHIKKIGS